MRNKNILTTTGSTDIKYNLANAMQVHLIKINPYLSKLPKYADAPMGSELEYLNSLTIGRAFITRTEI
jgi:recombinational DNA repair protein RecR